MQRTFGWMSAGLVALTAQWAAGQTNNDQTTTPVPDKKVEQAQTAPQNAPPGVERRTERRELRREGQGPIERAVAPALNGKGVNIDVPAAGVDVNAARGAGVGVAAPGVGVGVPPAGTGAGATVNVPAGGVQATVANPDGWRYRWHNNRWWYWHPNNRWSYWDNNRWNAYGTSSVASQPLRTRRFSNRPRYETGYRGVQPLSPSTQTSPTPASGATTAPATNSVPGYPLVPGASAGRNVNQSPLERANPGDASGPPSP